MSKVQVFIDLDKAAIKEGIKTHDFALFVCVPRVDDWVNLWGTRLVVKRVEHHAQYEHVTITVGR